MTTKTFAQFLQQHAEQHHIGKELQAVALSIVAACIKINSQVRLGALAGILGEAGSGNIQGEDQKKLDVIANQLLIDQLSINPHIAGLASEEEDTFVAGQPDGRYLVLFDPLDGSSNIDVNISVGTIFSVLAQQTATLGTESFLQAGNQQVLAGYVLYGPQTQLVLSFNHGVFAFTLNEQEQFILYQENIQIKEHSAEFAINMSNQRHWEAPVQQYIAELLQGVEGIRGKNYNMRWVASMVAEVHRILMRGGIFIYPKDNRDPAKAGKLRLMYEANPMSLLIKEASGAATNGYQQILDIQPEGLHQRVAVVLGSQEEVNYLTQKHQV